MGRSDPAGEPRRLVAAAGAATTAAVPLFHGCLVINGEDPDVEVEGYSRQGVVAVEGNGVVADLGNDHHPLPGVHPHPRLGLPAEGEGLLGQSGDELFVPYAVPLLGGDHKAVLFSYPLALEAAIEAGDNVSVTLPKGEGAAIFGATEDGAVGSAKLIGDGDVLIFANYHGANPE